MSPKTTPSAPTTSAAIAGLRVLDRRASAVMLLGTWDRCTEGAPYTPRALSGGALSGLSSRARPLLHAPGVLRHVPGDPVQLLGGAELHELGAGLGPGACPGGR